MFGTFRKLVRRPTFPGALAMAAFGLMPADATYAQTNILAAAALLVAVYENRVVRVRELLVRQHPKSRADTDGRTALIWGAIEGSYDAIELLLKDKARVDLVDSVGNGALYYAAENGYLDVVELLLYFDAAIDLENRDGRTPLMAAVRGGHAQIVQLLIDKGADVTISDFTGRTALDLARDSRSRQVTAIVQKAAR